MAQAALTIAGLSKRYGSRVAVDDLTLEVPHGTVAGFIGPNGAGKTTTMAMLCGLVRPSSGEAIVLGEPISRPERYLHRVGALLEGPALWPALTGGENLRVLARLGGHPEKRIPEVLDLVGLAGRGHDRFAKYSHGMKQRLGIGAALLGQPELLILDEPTNGLDPAGMADMRDLIARIAAEDRTVVVSTHILSELEQVCDWLIIIDTGRLVYAGPAETFASTSGIEIWLRPAHPAMLLALANLVASEGLEADREGDSLVIPVDGRDPRQVAASLNHAAAGAGIVLAELQVRHPSLEARYLTLLEGEAK